MTASSRPNEDIHALTANQAGGEKSKYLPPALVDYLIARSKQLDTPAPIEVSELLHMVFEESPLLLDTYRDCEEKIARYAAQQQRNNGLNI